MLDLIRARRIVATARSWGPSSLLHVLPLLHGGLSWRLVAMPVSKAGTLDADALNDVGRKKRIP